MISSTHDHLPDLLRCLRHPLPEIRCKSAKSIGRLGPQAAEAASLLAATLNDEDASVREACAQALGSIGKAALPQLIRMCSHYDKYVRRHAVWALGKLGTHATPAIPDLCHLLKDADPRTASGAAQSLGALGELAADAVPMLVEAMCGTNIVLCRLAAKALSEIGKPALPALIAHLRHTDPFVRGEAAMAIGWIGPEAREAVPHLLEVLQLGRPPLMDKEPPAVSELVNANSPTPTTEESTRANAAQALGRIGSNPSFVRAALRNAQRDPSEHVRRAVLTAIKQLSEQTTDDREPRPRP